MNRESTSPHKRRLHPPDRGPLDVACPEHAWSSHRPNAVLLGPYFYPSHMSLSERHRYRELPSLQGEICPVKQQLCSFAIKDMSRELPRNLLYLTVSIRFVTNDHRS